MTNFFKLMNGKNTGYIVRRYISFLGHIVAMIIVMKLTWMGGMTESYFGIYVGFIAGHASLDKYIANKRQPDDKDKGKEE